MDAYDYEQVPITEKYDTYSWKPLFRQLLVCSVIWVCFFMYGMGLGGPTVIIPQIKDEANNTDIISNDMESWLSAIYGYGGMPWVIILPIAARLFGRKVPFICVCINAVIAFTAFYTSSSVTQIFVSEIFESIIGSSLTTIAILVITEYTAPEYRGIFLTFKSATLFWGIWAANTIGTFCHWKVIALVKLILSIYPLVAVFFWPESPYWLASKRKLDACIVSHRYLKGTNAASEKELKGLLHTAKSSRCTSNERVFTRKEFFGGITAMTKKEFYKPTLLSFLVFALYSFSGKMACASYSIDIIKSITNSKTAAYRGMLILDGVTVFGMYVGCVLSKFLRRRTLLLVSSSVGVVSLLILSLYVYLIKVTVLSENQYVSIFLLMMYSFGICCGPMIMSTSIYGELLPLSYRSTAVCIIAISDKFMMGTILKLTPFVIRKFGLEGAFLFFGFTSAICVFLIYLYLPETKDKTLQEIANLMKKRDLANISEKDEQFSAIKDYDQELTNIAS